ncbi:hypothetical protein B0T39_19550 [Chromobacterium haemolyticum]|nr:hypothetical protein B0T39_19550 [Chromobacterium haemolyticum]
MRTRLVYAGCIAIWLVLSALVALSIASHALLGAEQQFNRDALLLSEQLNQKLQSHETVLDSYATFSALDRRSDLPSEKRLARQLLRRYPPIQWLGHIERISPDQLPIFGQRLKQLYGQALPMPAASGDGWGGRFGLFPLVFIEPMPQSSLLAADLGRLQAARQALQNALESGRMEISSQIKLPGLPAGYLLIRAMDDMLSKPLAASLAPAHFAAMAIRADSLLPSPLSLREGVEVRLFHRNDPPPGPPALLRGPERASALETLLFPRLEARHPLGGANQPLLLTINQQLGWRQIGTFEWGMLLVLSLALLTGLLLVSHHYLQLAHGRRQRENQLFYLANHDRLTGLANRNLFYDRLQHAISRVDRSGKRLALLFLDLDRFKPVNDTYGHITGDRILQLIAARIKEELRGEDTVARLGGDEFVVLMEDIESNREADKIVNRLKQVIHQPYEVNDHLISVGVSIGIAYYPEDGLLIDELLTVADRKMYGNKREIAAAGAETA